MLQMNEKVKTKQIHFHFFNGKKFKTNIIGVLFRTPLSRKDATKTALLAEVLKNGCKAYPSKQAVAIKNEEMYGSIYDVSILKKGDEQILFFYFEFLKCNEDLLEQGMSFLQQMIQNPLIEDNAFPKEIMEREKKFLQIKLSGKKDDKKEFAKFRCLEEMFQDEAFGISADGYEEDLENIDGNQLFQHYAKIRKHAPIEVLFMGDREQKQMVKDRFQKLEICEEDVWDLHIMEQHMEKKKRKEIVEENESAQSRLCVGLSTRMKPQDIPALLITSEILGGSSSSLLFEIMREKEGLCYYVNSFVFRLKGVIFIQAGISSKDYDKSISIIEKIIEKMKTQKVDEQRLKNAKDALINYHTHIADIQTAQMNFAMDEYLAGTGWTYNQFMDELNKVSEEDVCRMAKSINFDTIYFLKGKEE